MVLCRKCAKRIFDTTPYIVGAAKPRGHLVGEGEASEHQTRS